jgi:hypothetical protein
LNWRKFVKFVSKVFADGHHLIFLHFARKTFNPWAGLKTVLAAPRGPIHAGLATGSPVN